jgi:uncharacterized protein with HEPN domain
MSKRDFRILLEDIVVAIDRIKSYTSGMDISSFAEDRKTIDAVVRNLEIIGEASNRVPKSVKQKYDNIEWHKIISVRNRIIHEYFGVDYEIVWEIITKSLDDLKVKISKILKEYPPHTESLF